MNKEIIKRIKSLQNLIILGMITVDEYNERFAIIMDEHNREYKKAAKSIKH